MKLYHFVLCWCIVCIIVIIIILYRIEGKIDDLTMTKEVYWLLPSDTACSELWKRCPKIYVKGEKDLLWYEKESE